MVPKMVAARSCRYQEDDVTLMDVNCNVSICEGLVPFWSRARLGKWAIISQTWHHESWVTRALRHGADLTLRSRAIHCGSSLQSSHRSHLYWGPGGQKAEAISALLALSIIKIVALSIFMTVYLRGCFPYPIIQNGGRYRIIFSSFNNIDSAPGVALPQ